MKLVKLEKRFRTCVANNPMSYATQNSLLMNNLVEFYKDDKTLSTMMSIVTGEAKSSLRLVDWFTTNYAKKYYTVIPKEDGTRFKVYFDYKLKLKAYSKRRFDPFCRWDRINMPYKDGTCIETTIGQLNFFKWAIENGVTKYIEENYEAIEHDMNTRNSTSKRKEAINNGQHTRKKREELSISATKSVKKEEVEIVVTFN